MANKPNDTSNFYPARGNWRFTKLPMKASTALTQGALLAPEISGNTTTGYWTLAPVESASGANIGAILMETVASTDADYATAGKLKQVAIPMDIQAEAYFTVINGTFTTADVNKTVQIDSTSLGLDVDTAGKGAAITQYISSTRGMCKFPMPYTETA